MTEFLQLHITGSSRAARSVEVTGTTTIGRDSDNDIVLDELTISRCHALLYLRAGHVAIMDLESANGTFVNGIQVPPDAPVRLADGDLIRIGQVIARYTVTRTDRILSGARHGVACNAALADTVSL
jgi:pSer/pThr/pTyr-binding forkhead associated (FHA) protein